MRIKRITRECAVRVLEQLETLLEETPNEMTIAGHRLMLRAAFDTLRTVPADWMPDQAHVIRAVNALQRARRTLQTH